MIPPSPEEAADGSAATEEPSGSRARELSPRVRHDLRSCLGRILGYSELWMEDLPEAEHPELVLDLQHIHAAGRQVLAFVNEYIDPLPAGADNSAHEPLASVPAVSLPNETVNPYRSDRSEEKTSNSTAAILIVDDDETNRNLLYRRLVQQGYVVFQAKNGLEALEQIAVQPLDLILLDIMMPEMDGYAVLERLKADPVRRHLPIIMISALDEVDSIIRCIELGAEDYLSKPFNPTLLQARLGASLEKKRLRDHEQHLLHQLEVNYQRLQGLEQLRDDLTHMIVHDLRTPLTSLLTGLQTVEFLDPLSAEQREVINIAARGGQTLLEMISNLLDINKMESGVMILERREVTPADLVQEAVDQVKPLLQEKALLLRQNVEANSVRLQVDADKVRRALVNLLGNAIKFTQEGGIITVSVGLSEEETKVVFSVEDTGEGIPAEALDHIFEKFGQVETRKAGRKMSSGLGLTFSKMVVEAHGGRIWAESVLGQGSVFRFMLPIAPEPMPEEAT